MVGEAVNGRWLSGLLPVSRKSASDGKEVIGILAFEVAGLMSKVVSLWHSLSNREIMITKEWIVKSVGVKMLVSDDEDFLMELALSEILNNFESLAWSVARLSKRCKDPGYHGYEHFLHNPAQHYVHWSGWEYAWKKMERKVKKMDRFVAAMSLLSQELEVLAEREQTFRRMKANRQLHGGKLKLLEFHKRVMWQRQQVKTLRDMSPWNRSHDYVVRLLARSLFTILERIILVFGHSPIPMENQENESLTRSHSFSSLMHSSKTDSRGFSSQRFESNSKQGFEVNKTKNKSNRKKKKHQVVLHSESKQFKNIGPFIGCMSVENNSPVAKTCMTSNVKNIEDKKSLRCRRRIYFKLYMKDRLRAGECTLGFAALALHYANVIVLIEKMASAPHLIDHETRDDLYDMLPATIRSALRSKLKWYAKSTRASFHETGVAVEWSLVVSHILEWLAPLAHNMIKWYSERNFEREQSGCKANVLLVQTLYFADQAKAEAAMVELLVGLHYVCRIHGEARLRAARESAGSRVFSSDRLKKNELYNRCF
ncbi:uncharacterized protein LOC114190918 [Vigna unguiculata]|uniref:DUF668 domain-containing protein n=1 Tax=Vigna unguiculata TaxID=3917 RepID=A0A4D6MWT5_VIGUN|nr:uncharacterized protein LOC114190918 [Vigna unguiculata]QCE05903.1 hypothetical protein DEO72_LG9g912 [Vigna unguiculata]